MGQGRCAAVAVLAIIASGCVDPTADLSFEGEMVGDPAPFQTIDKGTDSGIQRNRDSFKAIFDQDGWLGFWAEHTSNQEPPPSAPTIDFRSRFIAAIVLAEQSSGGHTVAVTRVVHSSERFVLGYETREPGRDCLTAGALTQPFHVVSLARAEEDFDVRFKRVAHHVTEC